MQTTEMIIQLVLPPRFPSQSKLRKKKKKKPTNMHTHTHSNTGVTVWELNTANKNRTEQGEENIIRSAPLFSSSRDFTLFLESMWICLNNIFHN